MGIIDSLKNITTKGGPARRTAFLKALGLGTILCIVGGYNVYIHGPSIARLRVKDPYKEGKGSLKEAAIARKDPQNETIKSSALVQTDAAAALFAEVTSVPTASHTPASTEPAQGEKEQKAVQEDAKEQPETKTNRRTESYADMVREIAPPRARETELSLPRTGQNSPRSEELVNLDDHDNSPIVARNVADFRKIAYADPKDSGRTDAPAEASRFFGYGSNYHSDTATSRVYGDSQLKAGAEATAVLLGDVLANRTPKFVSARIIGPLNNLSNFPDGMTMLGSVSYDPDTQRAEITFDKCANDNVAAAALPCKGVARDYGGAQGLSGRIYSRERYTFIIDMLAQFGSTSLLERITKSYDTLGNLRVDQTKSNQLQVSIADAIQKGAQVLEASLPSTSITISGGTLFRVYVTESVQLWN